MRIRMLRDNISCDDGVHPILRKAGQVYDVPETLAWMLDPAKGIAEQDKMMEGPTETKNIIPPQAPVGESDAAPAVKDDPPRKKRARWGK
jgi:hypothetical protein